MPRYEKGFCIWYLLSLLVHVGAGKSNLMVNGHLKDANTVPKHDVPLTGFSQRDEDNLLLSPTNLTASPVIAATRLTM
jgi:hypothetical protein